MHRDGVQSADWMDCNVLTGYTGNKQSRYAGEKNTYNITHLGVGLMSGALSNGAERALQQREGDAVQLEHLLAEDVRGGGGRSGTLHQR